MERMKDNDSETLTDKHRKLELTQKLLGNVIAILLVFLAIVFGDKVSSESKPIYTLIYIVSIWLSFSYYFMIVRNTKKTDKIFWLFLSLITIYFAMKDLI